MGRGAGVGDSGRGFRERAGAVICMTIEMLKSLADHALEFGLECLQDGGELHMMFHLALRAGGIEMMVVAGDVTNDEDLKAQLAATIKARIAAGEIEAVIMLSDTWFAENIAPEADRIRQAFRMTIEQAAAAGLCEKREAVMVRLESPIYWLHMQQEYVRSGERIEVKGERTRTDSLDGGPNYKARFTNFFGPPAASEARRV
jgi:hypothetical protein